MFEKFTEKAINVVTEAQEQAKLMQNAYVQPEHLLLAIAKQAKGVSLKLFRMYSVSYDNIKPEVENKLRFEKSPKSPVTVPFSDEFKHLLKNTLDLANKSGNVYVLFEHLFLSAISEKSYNKRILEKLNFDIDNAQNILYRMVQKKSKRLSHPEIEDSKEQETQNFNAETLFKDNESISKIFENAYSKLS